MNEFVEQSTLIANSFNARYINLWSPNTNNKIINKSISIINLIRYAFLISYHLVTFKPENVYFTISPVNAFYRDLIYVLLLKLSGAKLIYHLHGKGIKKKAEYSNINLMLYKWAYKNVYVILLSRKLLSDIKFLPINKYYIVPNGIEQNEKYECVEKGFNELPQILFLSHLIESKGVYDFLDALKILSNRNVSFTGVMIGNEVEITSQDILSRMNGAGQSVQFLGPKYGREKLKVLTAASLLVYPSFNDTFPLVILEALSVGIPIVATNEGAITDMIEDGVNGFIVDKQNPQAIADKIEQLLLDRQLMKRMSENNRAKFEQKFTIDKFEQNICRVIREVAKDDF